MASHRKVGGMEISLPAPFKFKKRNSAHNICVGKAMKGQTWSGRADWNKKFANAAKACGGMV